MSIHTYEETGSGKKKIVLHIHTYFLMEKASKIVK